MLSTSADCTRASSLTRFDLRGDRDGFGLDVESEGRNGSRADRGRSSFDGQFDVVRIVFQAAHDHDVLDPPRDEELAVLKKAEIASSEEWTLESVRKVSPKAAAGLVRTTPVSAGDALARDPDLSDFAVPAGEPCCRIDDLDARRSFGRTAADDGRDRCPSLGLRAPRAPDEERRDRASESSVLHSAPCS